MKRFGLVITLMVATTVVATAAAMAQAQKKQRPAFEPS